MRWALPAGGVDRASYLELPERRKIVASWSRPTRWQASSYGARQRRETARGEEVGDGAAVIGSDRTRAGHRVGYCRQVGRLRRRVGDDDLAAAVPSEFVLDAVTVKVTTTAGPGSSPGGVIGRLAARADDSGGRDRGGVHPSTRTRTEEGF
jgi:hypothetical protein